MPPYVKVKKIKLLIFNQKLYLIKFFANNECAEVFQFLFTSARRKRPNVLPLYILKAFLRLKPFPLAQIQDDTQNGQNDITDHKRRGVCEAQGSAVHKAKQ